MRIQEFWSGLSCLLVTLYVVRQSKFTYLNISRQPSLYNSSKGLPQLVPADSFTNVINNNRDKQ